MLYIDSHGKIVIIVERGFIYQSSNPKVVCISHRANTLGKGMNPTLLSPAKGK